MEEQEQAAREAIPQWSPHVEFFQQALGFRVGNYGMTRWGDLFTPRQLVVLTTLSDLVADTMERVRHDARAAGLADDERPGHQGRARAYAQAVSVYLGLATSKTANRSSMLCTFKIGVECPGDTFGRQALPMSWDYAEANTLNGPSGSFESMVQNTAAGLVSNGAIKDSRGRASQADAAVQAVSLNKVLSTDPPYYDNIGYADLSDFFYVWLRRSLKPLLPDLFSTLAVPKGEELVATPYRHGNKAEAERFFLGGMTKAMRQLSEQAHPAFPITIYYAFKQSETKGGAGTASTGWETFLQAVIRAGFGITGTWPVRTERENRKRNQQANALASSIVLVCRPRSADAETASRRHFLTALRSELPGALADLQMSNIAPVDLAQAAIGPGMAAFTRYGQVLEADGSPMSVRSALVEINRILDETLAKQEGDLDPDTRFCVAWYEQYGLTERAYGEAEVLFNAKNTSFEGLRRAGVIAGGQGKVRIVGRDELDPEWDPATGQGTSDWMGAQHMTRALTSERGGGVVEAARLVRAMGAGRAERARALAYRLHALAERNTWADEAQAYNVLVTSWPQIQAEAARLGADVAEQADFDLAADGSS